MIFASFGSKQGCLRGMAWQTSIEAAQRFLRSVKTLSSYGDIVEKQNAGVETNRKEMLGDNRGHHLGSAASKPLNANDFGLTADDCGRKSDPVATGLTA